MIRTVTLVEDTNVSDSDLNLIINLGLHEISAAYDWPWLETSLDLTPLDSVQTLDLPDNFDVGIALINNGSNTVIPFIGSKSFFELTANLTTEGSNPSLWTVYDGSIYLYPVPQADDADGLTLVYHSQVSDMAYDTDEPPFHKAYHWTLIEYAKWKLYEMEEYYDQSERSRVLYISYLNDMRAWYGRAVRRAPFLWGDGVRSPQVSNLPILDEI